jgi:hypothetical protein
MKSLADWPAGACIAGAVVVVEVGAIAIHSYVHHPIEAHANHQVVLYAAQPVVLPDNHQRDPAGPEANGRITVATSTSSASTSAGTIWHTPGWPI